MPLDNCGGLDQHHRIQAARPQPIEADPEQAVDSKKPGPTRSLSAENGQLMSKGENLQFQKDSATKPQRKQHQDGSKGAQHSSDGRRASYETLALSQSSAF